MDLKKYVRDVADFPKPGIMFKDITPLLSSPEAFSNAIEQMADKYKVPIFDGIAKALVERMGGQIGFETARGVGTTFYIDLPEWRAEPETTNADENQTTAFVIVPCTPNLNNYQGKG